MQVLRKEYGFVEIKDIKELIAFDQKTMQDVIDIHDKKNEALKALAREKEEIKKKTWDEVRQKVETTKKELDAKIASDAKINTQAFEEGAKRIKETYAANKDKWIKEVFERCID